MKNLICINTYNSLSLIKTFIWDYIIFTKSNTDYDFVISLDGIDRDTIDYCERYHIPLLYSEENEGVGLSKNRVIEHFPDYDNYFFIEDDVELLNSEVFDIHVSLAQKLNIHHFSLFEADRIRNKMNVVTCENYHIIQAMYGSAQVNFFTRSGLDTVGGFHTEFAKYKRFGHTEHSYRFFHAGLSKYPFQVIEECIEGFFRWNNPKSRININVEKSENRLFMGEEELIEKKLTFFPLQTLSEYHCINMKNIKNSADIRIDSNFKRYKKTFYFKSALKNTLGKIKRIILFQN